MLKLTALLFNTFALLIYQFFFADVVTITQKSPASAKPDTEFTIELTISKGTNGGFAKLQQNLPEGFTAVADNSNGASFAFNNQAVKFIWMSLPSDAEFKVSYKVVVAPGTTGDKNITGKFSFVADNKKQTIEIAPSIVNISDTEEEQAPLASEDAASKFDTEEEEAENNIEETAIETPMIPPVKPNTSDDLLAIDCFRTTVNDAGACEFPVEVTIKKGNLSGFAKFIERLPEGFTATVVDAKGAAFSFIDQKVKFVWGTLPKEDEFKISYKLNVAEGVSGDLVIEGVFAFIENDRTKKFVLPQTAINIPAGGCGAVAPIADSGTEENTEQAIEEDTIEEDYTETNDEDIASADEGLNEETVADEFDATKVQTPQGSVSYRVQILALIQAENKAKPKSVIAQLLNVQEERINIEADGGFKKFTVGRHSEYQVARDVREDLPNQVTAPFVAAYNYGKRITVQEALMISNQQWTP